MPKVTSIIVAIDFSEPSLEALRQAETLAWEMKAELVVFHAIPNLVRANPLFPHQNIEDVFQLPAIMDRATQAVEEVIETHLSKGLFNVRIVVDTGWPDTALLRKAEEIDANLIVVGSRGYTGLKHVLLGSVAERVIRYAHCPVLVARPAPKHGKILAATDFSDPAWPAVEMASEITKLRNADLTVMHSLGAKATTLSWAATPFGGGPIVPDEKSIQEARAAAHHLIETSLERFATTASIVVTDGLAQDEIVRQATVLSAELVVLGNQGRSAIQRIALGGVAETVARTAPCSVLVVRLTP
ncbi:MAG TPA: universal stress protein [Polyangiaceae bacterium]|nr:MAG: Universal stress protein [Deltaproteobacteria bacterium ADurb.Bin207]HNZ22003.1 universal stress protein [Polyangiaceae bacterium]HOE47311.1 universal stress protein [Polyangiaceae bacterium]HOH00624.1 universal stress protein [Polyangiaceae bacterium]HOR36174.1 universal stress protein [Polyangiaceae bacterium]